MSKLHESKTNISRNKLAPRQTTLVVDTSSNKLSFTSNRDLPKKSYKDMISFSDNLFNTNNCLIPQTQSCINTFLT